jgi:hypothetical protein
MKAISGVKDAQDIENFRGFNSYFKITSNNFKIIGNKSLEF